MIGWLQLMVMLSLMLPPVTVTRAIYVPDGGGNPYWLPLNSNDPEPPGGPDWNDDGYGSPNWWVEYQAAANSGTIVWWGGGDFE